MIKPKLINLEYCIGQEFKDI